MAVPLDSPKLFQFMPHLLRGPIFSKTDLISKLVAFLVKFLTIILTPLLLGLKPLCLFLLSPEYWDCLRRGPKFLFPV